MTSKTILCVAVLAVLVALYFCWFDNDDEGDGLA